MISELEKLKEKSYQRWDVTGSNSCCSQNDRVTSSLAYPFFHSVYFGNGDIGLILHKRSDELGILPFGVQKAGREHPGGLWLTLYNIF